MTEPKLHHYVPQFYLRRFADDEGRLWLWDKQQDRIFQGNPNGIAAENKFYDLTGFIEEGLDTNTMEKQFSQLEGEVAKITSQWLDWLRSIEGVHKVEIPSVNRELIALYIALQFYRTLDMRELFALFKQTYENTPPLTSREMRLHHLDVLWGEGIVLQLAKYIETSVWLFGHNKTALPFITSDNPVAFRAIDNSKWTKIGIGEAKTYVVFPLAPDIIMYCYPPEPPWNKLVKLDCCLSPVTFTEDMVDSENGGQVFMASRFVVSCINNFESARKFFKTIGTDEHAPYWNDKKKEL